MKPLNIIILTFWLTLISCNQSNRSGFEQPEDVITNDKVLPIALSDSTAEVQNLIREVLKWANSESIEGYESTLLQVKRRLR